MKRFIPITLFCIGISLFVLNMLLLYVPASKFEPETIYYPLAPKTDDSKTSDQTEKMRLSGELADDKNILNILLLGIDRRSKFEGYRTDIMILVSINMDTNRVLLTSVPRDLWHEGQRINATFLGSGFEELADAFNLITGHKPKKFILTDFVDFSWIVDAMGGVEVNVERDFVDTRYPVDETLEYQTVSFTKGSEKLTGERALIYARSRKGTNGEGSDWARMKRQHLILNGMIEAIFQPGSIFKDMDLEKIFALVTEGRMDTNLELNDLKFFYDMYKDRDDYVIESIFLDNDFVYSPPMSDYGGAWVLAPLGGTYEPFHEKIDNFLFDLETEIPEDITIDTSNTGPNDTPTP